MGKYFSLFLFILLGAAILLGEHTILTLVYLFVGALFAGKFWGQKVMNGLQVQRSFTPWVFLDEKARVKLSLANASFLPAPWLQLRESLPVEMHTSGPFQQVLHLGAKSQVELEYTLDCRRRGVYTLGPLDIFSGDVLGVAKIQQMTIKPALLTVYPRIIQLSQVKIPSHAPLGSLRHTQPLLEDPSRAWGKREYVRGDSLRRIDWKASAASGSLQVKLFEPSISLETMIFLNMNTREYELKTRYFTAELAVVIAASLANWIISRRQSVGLVTNGTDSFTHTAQVQSISEDLLAANPFRSALPAKRGRAHLLRLLETLARVQLVETDPFANVLHKEITTLPWGATLIVLSNKIDDALFESLFRARQKGMDAMLVQCGQSPGFAERTKRAAYFGFPLIQVLDEDDLDIWRQ